MQALSSLEMMVQDYGWMANTLIMLSSSAQREGC